MLKRAILICIFLLKLMASIGQQNSTIDLTKERPPKYKNKVLRAEKTGDGKLKGISKLYQNTVTHYNYVFNAREKLKDIIAQAKKSHKDDYTKMLSFYNYDLKTTAGNKDLDTVISKATAGILKHDLRTSWVDELYRLMGEAYFYKNRFDTANIIFQYINYAFAPKDEGYDLPIGSNIANTNGELSISSKENVNLWKRLSGHYPRRNDALLWIVHCNTEMGNYTLANGILQLLYNDNNFPERLKPDLDEMMAYWFFQQKNYDSAVIYLEKCRDNVASGNEKARRSFLLAQLYATTAQDSAAIANYLIAAKEANDPVMEAYANLNSIDVTVKGKPEFANERLRTLLGLAKRDKFIDSRDIIYYAAAQVELKNNNTSNAKDLLKKSIKANEETKNSRQLMLDKMLMGDIDYNADLYAEAGQAYQNINESELDQTAMRERLALRKQPLSSIGDKLKIIHVEDSLQSIATMPEAARKALLRKMVRQIRKKFGLKEEQEFDNSNFMGKSDSTPANLFANNMVKGDWYFNNQSIKSIGYNSFKQKFGNRPNVDNWQRQSVITSAAKPIAANISADNDTATHNSLLKKPIDSVNITLLNLEDGLPLTKEKMQLSNDKIANALLTNGKIFQNNLENYPAAIASYNELLRRFPSYNNAAEALTNLYTCYMLLHQNNKADSVRMALNAMGKENLLSFTTEAAITSNKNPIGKEYERIYDLFIEGKFEEARSAKLKADSLYGTIYWTPQLIYIEAIDFVTNRQDSIAIVRLNYLINKFSTSPMKPKAQNMINILKNRKSIEDYLTKLQITRKEDTEEEEQEDLASVTKKQTPKAAPAKDSVDITKKEPNKSDIAAQSDSVRTFKSIAKQTENIRKDSSNIAKRPGVPSLDTTTMKPSIAINKAAHDIPSKQTDTTVAITNPERAFKPVDKNVSNTQKDSTGIALQQQPNIANDSAANRLSIQQAGVPQAGKTKTDSALAKGNPAIKPSVQERDATNKTKVSDSSFTIDPTASHYVMVLLNNVVYVFANEAKNAFEIYNSQTFTDMVIPIFSESINSTHNAILMGPFGDAVLAADYIQKVKGVTKNIVPWLQENRYSFAIISAKNLELLRKNKKLDEYLQLLHKAMPDRF